MKKKIDWEQRRYQASVQIISGIYANANNRFSGGVTPEDLEQVENAVILAERLISILADENRPSLCDKIIFTNVESECSSENQELTGND